MGTIYRRGGKLWIAFRDADGKRRWAPSGFDRGQEPKARALLEKVESQVAAARRWGASVEPLTVGQFAKKFMQTRTHLAGYRSEDSRVRLHVLSSSLAQLHLAEVRPRHLVEFARGLREGGRLAPRTVRHVYEIVRSMFAAAVLEDLLPANPCVLTQAHLGRKEDKDPEWRARAIYTRDELESLISDERLPQARRVLYALGGIGGLRQGEIAALRWRHYDPDAQPLGQLVIANSNERRGTKTGGARDLPVHPTLAAMLAEWRLSGWGAAFGRRPHSDDFVVPAPNCTMLRHGIAYDGLQADLELLGLRHRRFHDLRRTMISLSRADGARPDLLKMVTHGKSKSILDIYTEMPREALCAEVTKLRIERRTGRVLSLPRVAQVGEKTRPGVTVGVTVPMKTLQHKADRGEPRGARTHDPRLKRPLLYRLS